jgi:hypothetical protein
MIGITKLVIKYFLEKDGILHKSESWYETDPWTITSVHKMGKSGLKLEQNQNDLSLRQSHHFSTIKLKKL